MVTVDRFAKYGLIFVSYLEIAVSLFPGRRVMISTIPEFQIFTVLTSVPAILTLSPRNLVSVKFNSECPDIMYWWPKVFPILLFVNNVPVLL